MAKLKYMGTADRRVLEKGEDFGGRLGTPLTKEVVWSTENNWVVDSAEAGLSAAAVELLTEKDSGFRDVSGMDRVPVNEHQKMFLGMKGTEEVAEGDESEIKADDPEGDDEKKAAGGGSPRGSRTR